MSEQRDELHHLIDSLPDEQVESILTDVRTAPRAAPDDKAFAWIGSFSGPPDLSTNSEHLEGFGRD